MANPHAQYAVNKGPIEERRTKVYRLVSGDEEAEPLTFREAAKVVGISVAQAHRDFEAVASRVPPQQRAAIRAVADVRLQAWLHRIDVMLDEVYSGDGEDRVPHAVSLIGEGRKLVERRIKMWGAEVKPGEDVPGTPDDRDFELVGMIEQARQQGERFEQGLQQAREIGGFGPEWPGPDWDSEPADAPLGRIFDEQTLGELES